MKSLKILFVFTLDILFCNSFPKYRLEQNNENKSFDLSNEEGQKDDLNLENDKEVFQCNILMTKKQQEYVKSSTYNMTTNQEIKIEDFLEEAQIRNKRNVKKDLSYRWDFPIPYFVEEGVSEYLVEKAIYFIEQETCVTFEKVDEKKSNVSGIVFQYGSGCKSYIGKQPGKKFQEIVLGDGCKDVGRVQHEILHALGFFHEQNRNDRDQYIDILLENVIEEEKFNFMKLTTAESNLMGFNYDYGSIMHYGIYSFSKNKKPTMLPKDLKYKKTIGHSDKASFIDYKMINLHYCSKECKTKIPCYNGAYQHPKFCFKCKCVEGFAGVDCSQVQKPEVTCSNPLIKANEIIKKFQIKGVRNCFFHFFAPKGMKVAIKILSSSLYPNKKTECLALNAIEVKFWTDKTTSGARLCLKSENIIFKSQNNHIIFYYRSSNAYNNVSLLYKAIDAPQPIKPCGKKIKNKKKKSKSKH